MQCLCRYSASSAICLAPRYLHIQLYRLYTRINLCRYRMELRLACVFPRNTRASGSSNLSYGNVTYCKIVCRSQSARTSAGIWSSSFAVSAVIGPLLGGYLIDHFSWRMIFYINLPIGILGLIMTLMYLPQDTPTERGRFDWLARYFLREQLLVWCLCSTRVRVGAGAHFPAYCATPAQSCLDGSRIGGDAAHAPIIDFNMFKNPVIVSV